MKKVAKIVGATIIGLGALLLILSFTGFDLRTAHQPTNLCHADYQGFRLKGEPVTRPVADWSFTDKIPGSRFKPRHRFCCLIR